jgi:hypothetical protein
MSGNHYRERCERSYRKGLAPVVTLATARGNDFPPLQPSEIRCIEPASRSGHSRGGNIRLWRNHHDI